MQFVTAIFLSLFALVSAAKAQSYSRVFNGSLATSSQWVVSLSDKGTDPAKSAYCGGVVIDPSWVLTAAHCAEPSYDEPHSMQVLYGSTDLRSGSIVGVDGIIVHEKYQLDSDGYDIALLHLAKPIAVTPLSIYDQGETFLDNSSATVYGWGTTESSPNSFTPSLELRAGVVDVPKQSICKNGLGNLFEPGTMLCAGILSSAKGKYDGVDGCYGDSGGPLVTRIFGIPQLIGLVSWGLECASHTSYGVYSNVVRLKSWLDKPRVIPSYALDKPIISGVAEIGQRLTCKAPHTGGNTPLAIKFKWRDASSYKVLSSGKYFSITPSMVRHRLICEVELLNLDAPTFADSDVSKQIAQRSTKIKTS